MHEPFQAWRSPHRVRRGAPAPAPGEPGRQRATAARQRSRALSSGSGAARRRPAVITRPSSGRPPSTGSSRRASRSWSASPPASNRCTCFRPGKLTLSSDSFIFGPVASATSLYTAPRLGASALVPSWVPTPNESIGAPAATRAAIRCSSRSPTRRSGSPAGPRGPGRPAPHGRTVEIARVEPHGRDPDPLAVELVGHPRRPPAPSSCRRCRSTGPCARGRPGVAPERLLLGRVPTRTSGPSCRSDPGRAPPRRARATWPQHRDDGRTGALHAGGVGAVVAARREVDERPAGTAGRRHPRRLAGHHVLVATVLSRNVSTSCASIMGAVTERSGSSANAISPSAMAHTSP